MVYSLSSVLVWEVKMNFDVLPVTLKSLVCGLETLRGHEHDIKYYILWLRAVVSVVWDHGLLVAQ